jgi:hypothetical protein
MSDLKERSGSYFKKPMSLTPRSKRTRGHEEDDEDAESLNGAIEDGASLSKSSIGSRRR